MPYRHVPAHKRPHWEQACAAWLAGWVALGAYGLVHPSAALLTALGFGQVIYSVACAGLGLVGLYAWWHGYRAAVLRTMWTLLVLTIVHGLGVWVMAGGDGGQTAIRILNAAVGTYAWIGARSHFALSHADVAEVTAQIGASIDPGRDEE